MGEHADDYLDESAAPYWPSHQERGADANDSDFWCVFCDEPDSDCICGDYADAMEDERWR